METKSIYQDIATRTDGDIYIGVVGPVRTGKSTFIKKFMETLVIPNIDSDYRRERATDELPQSAAGRTIMTTEPKFIPEEAVQIKVDDAASLQVRMIDCVGYIVPSSLGYVENNAPRMVMTPWFEQEIPFNMAAEIGTQKVITEHSTIGLVVTTDGSISDIPRAEYEEAEMRVIDELRQINKPFVVLLNCMYPNSPDARAMRDEMTARYQVPVIAVNCLELQEPDIREILASVLYEFPVREISVEMPRWILSLGKDHWLKSALMGSIFGACNDIAHMRELRARLDVMCECEHVSSAQIVGIDLGSGSARLCVNIQSSLFYKVLGETTGIQIESEEALMPCMIELARMKKEYEKVKGALDQVAATGYGIVMPSLEELSLEEPEIIKQGGRYGVRLKASAPSIHMMRANINTEVNPIVGSEKQSEDLVMYLLKEFEESPAKIWESNIFGKSLHELVNEGLHNKLYRMPEDARIKLQETIERIINEGCTGLICIIL
ncbi:stage IV sporulation protein A [Clostridiaceae bacterium NSJ-31]|uniref:Stage IV sporulation protein A n=3 Tax=Ligaoa zhengdingensis TaxID=2763658 RepID=A0A926DZR0_9FIRM|nr:stage IV sporulation protein A [Ligaoa zhengdingensis]MBC8546549.1 stage IV sporulation protein A [Ligaoa zhengdingensis]